MTDKTPPLNVTGFCISCKSKKQIANAKAFIMKNGRHAAKGECPDCGDRMFLIMKTPKPTEE